MPKKKKAPEAPAWSLFLNPTVHSARKRLPGKVRQRIGRAIDDLSRQPRPPASKELRLPEELEGDVSFPWEVRRLRIEDYRVIYALSTSWKEIAVLAVEKRPPYAYEDLDRLLEELLG